MKKMSMIDMRLLEEINKQQNHGGHYKYDDLIKEAQHLQHLIKNDDYEEHGHSAAMSGNDNTFKIASEGTFQQI